jgi:hypothetical protein
MELEDPGLPAVDEAQDEPAAADIGEEEARFAVALTLKALLGFICARNRWAPPTDEEALDMAQPATRIVLRYLPFLVRSPVLMDAVALGSSLGAFFAKRQAQAGGGGKDGLEASPGGGEGAGGGVAGPVE